MNLLLEYYKKYKEVIAYLFFGVLTTAINYFSYYIFAKLFDVDYLISTIIAWALSVLFAYITNKLFVFDSKSFDKTTLFRELSTFLTARIASGFIDVFIMYVFVDILHVNDLIVKLLSNVLIIIINYVFSKFIIFKKK